MSNSKREKKHTPGPSRRSLLGGILAGAALIVAARIGGTQIPHSKPQPPAPAPPPLPTWLGHI